MPEIQRPFALASLGAGLWAALAGCASASSSSLDPPALVEPTPPAPMVVGAPPAQPVSRPDIFATETQAAPPQASPPVAPAQCLRSAEFVPLGLVPEGYGTVWKAIDAQSSYVVWSQQWFGNDIRMQTFRWTAGEGITALTELAAATQVAQSANSPVDLDLYASLVSADGSTVAGARAENDRIVGGFRWTPAGQQPLDFDPAVLSHDGSVAVGVRPDGLLRWTSRTGTEPIDAPPSWISPSSLLASASADVIAGYDILEHSFRWTEATGKLDIGSLPGGSYTRVQFMDDSGDVLLGVAGDGASPRAHLVRWTAAEGLRDLATFPGASAQLTQISADGRVVLADVLRDDVPFSHTFLWSEAGGLQDLSPGARNTHGVYLSPKGDVVVGSFTEPSGLSGVFRWSEAAGNEDRYQLSVGPFAIGGGGNLLLDNGPSGPRLMPFGEPTARGPLFDLLGPGLLPDGWSRARLEGVSEDGGLLTGSALNPEGQRESWLLHAGRGLAPGCGSPH